MKEPFSKPKCTLALLFKSAILIFLCCIFTNGFSLDKPSLGKTKASVKVQNCLIPQENVYKQGIELIKKGKYKGASRHFFQMYTDKPGGKFAASAILLEAYCLYKNQDYSDALCALQDLETFHPNSHNSAYVSYLKLLCYEKQIHSLSGCSALSKNALAIANHMTESFPKSSYTEDVFKNHVPQIESYLNEKKMLIGRFHLNNLNPVGAILSFQSVVKNDKEGYFTQEALFRMIESYLMMGLKEEALKCQKALANQFPKSFWTKASQKQIFNTLTK